MFFWFFIFPEARKRKQTFDSVSSLQNSPSGRVLVVALLCLGHLRLIASSVVSSLRPVPIGHRMAGSHAPSSVTHTVCDHSLAGEVWGPPVRGVGILGRLGTVWAGLSVEGSSVTVAAAAREAAEHDREPSVEWSRGTAAPCNARQKCADLSNIELNTSRLDPLERGLGSRNGNKNR